MIDNVDPEGPGLDPVGVDATILRWRLRQWRKPKTE